MQHALDTPWKVWNELERWLCYPGARFLFALNKIPWGSGWRLYGLPIIQKHRKSTMRFGTGLGLRSSIRSNPLGPNHPTILCTWQAGAMLEVGAEFGMTGGSIIAAERIVIGRCVTVGCNTTIADTDFHPIQADLRQLYPQAAKTSPIVIGDNVFIGMNCLILKGVTIGAGSVIGAGSLVSRDIPPNTVAAGNPACVIKHLL